MRSTKVALVPCPCPFCGGKMVTSYIRRQHSRRYICSEGKPGSEFEPKRRRLTVAVPGPSSGSNDSASGSNCFSTGYRDSSSDGCGSAQNPYNTPAGPLLHMPDPATELPLFDPATELLLPDPETELPLPDPETELPLSDPATELPFSEPATELLLSDPETELPLSDPETELHVSHTSLEGFLALAQYDMSVYNSDIIKKPLYKNSEVTLLQAIVEHFTWFCEHPSISKTALSDILHMQHSTILPRGNLLPDSFDSALKVIEPFLLKPLILHSCQNDCLIFRGDYAECNLCPKCNANRYIRNCIPVKPFTYLPIGPRLVRLFGTSNLAQIVQTHTGTSNPSSDMFDIQDSSAWQNVYSKNGVFCGDPRGIALALCTDGVNPFHHSNVPYSMWPIVFTLLNLPRDVRQLFSNLILVGIVPGPSEPASLNPYLEVVVDELLSLTNLQVYDAYLKAPFSLKVEILLYVLDYPGVGKVFHTMGSGAYQGCMWCDIQGTYIEDLHKMVYIQNRRFLPISSDLRSDAVNFPDQSAEKRPPPQNREYCQVKAVHHAYDKAKNKAQAKAIAKETGCKGTYPLMKMQFHNRVSQTVPDAMHTIKDAVVHLFNIIVGREDSDKVRRVEMAIGRFGLDEPVVKTKTRGTRRSQQTVPSYRICPQEIQLANERSQSVVIPSPDFAPGPIFTKITGLKSHDWKELVCTGTLKFCLRGMLGRQQRQSLFYFLDAISLCCSEYLKPSEIDDLQERVHLAVALLERDFPMSIQVITMHLLHHIPEGIGVYGPVYGTWMFPYERFNSWMCRRALNRYRPEATIMETYRIYEWCQYMAMSGHIPAVSTNITSEITDNCRILSEEELHLLDEVYLAVIPQYRHLSDEYSKALKRATNARRKSEFPARDSWKPPFQISPQERELLCGPQPQIILHKKRVVQHERTKRKVTFTSAQHECAGSRHLCSYVQKRQFHGSVPIIGRIMELFTHSFGGTTFDMAMVHSFRQLQQDDECRMWWVLPKNFNIEIWQLSHLFSPRVVAKEGDKLWFLNIKETE